VYYELVVV